MENSGLNLRNEDDAGQGVAPIQSPESVFAPAKTLAYPKKTAGGRVYGAMDAAPTVGGLQYLFDRTSIEGYQGFAGYAALQALSQDALIRLCIKSHTNKILREWIEIKCEDSTRKDLIETAITEKKIKTRLHEAVELCGFMGGAYIFLDTGVRDQALLSQPLNFSDKSAELKPDAALNFVVIDPVYVSPAEYNSSNPLRADFFKPYCFYVMGYKVHHSRLIRFCENEVPQLLKPAYNFLGIPQAQLLSDYVKHFRENREESNRLLKKFSTSWLAMDLKSVLFNKGAWSTVTQRIKHFIRYRNNDGLGVLDKDSESFIQANTPLTGVTDIVRQSLEYVVAINQSNVVELLGLSPSGFNTGDSDIKTQNAIVKDKQEKILREPIETILKAIQLNVFGSIDPNLTFDFATLDPEDAQTKANTQKVKADTAAIYLDRGVVSEDEVRDSLKKDDESPFADLAGEAPGAPDAPFGQEIAPGFAAGGITTEPNAIAAPAVN